MAFTYTDPNGFTLITPQSSVTIIAQSAVSGTATTGVLALVGEADSGPSWDQDQANGVQLSSNAYAPSELPLLIAKYGSGRLVDAFAAAIVPSASSQIQGAPQQIYIVKTNQSRAASLADGSAGTFVATLAGENGNQISVEVATAQAEVAPTTGMFSYVPSASASAMNARVNGGALQMLAISANTAPPALVSAISGLSNITAVGGANELITTGLSPSNSVSLTVVAGQEVEIALVSGLFSGTPTAGDTLNIPAGSVLEGAGDANVGWYLVTAVSNTNALAQLTATKVTTGVPVAVSAVPFSSTPANDLVEYAPIAIDNSSNSGAPINGLGKALELWDGGGAVNINTMFFNLDTQVAASWIGQLLISAEELQDSISVKESGSSTESTVTVGGDVALTLGYSGTSASATISLVGGVLTLTTTVVGGSGSNLSLNLSKISTIADLVTQINASPGYSAGTDAQDANMNPSILDQLTFSIDSSLGNMPGRVKRDIYDLTAGTNNVSTSGLVKYVPIATAGLPPDMTFTFLSGGLMGGTTGLQFVNALDALQGVQTNFVVPLVSQNASLDIAAGLTDPSSTYMIDAVNAATRSHCLAMSNAKVKHNRIGIVSIRDTFANAQTEALNLANFRMACLFEDVINLSQSTGQLVQFQPWMGSAVAAGMQAAGNYKSIFNKTLNISGALQAAGDFNPGIPGQVDQAILAGLIPITNNPGVGYAFATDQTTYNIDNNVIYNSLQAVYVADLMALDLAQSLQTAFVGGSTADVTVSVVESFIRAKMSQYLGLKYIVGTTAAPAGWVNIDVTISGSVMTVAVGVIEATSIKFIPITLSVSGVQASASSSSSQG
jgi:hypothetical protein